MECSPSLKNHRLPIILFLFVRLCILLALPFDGLRGYGDMLHFFNLAALPGLPYIHSWSEFPPALSVLVRTGLPPIRRRRACLHLPARSCCSPPLTWSSVWLFTRLTAAWRKQPAIWRGVLFAALLAALPYTWWYFDSLVIFFTLLAFELALSRRPAVVVGGGARAGHSHQTLPRPDPASVVALAAAPPRRLDHRLPRCFSAWPYTLGCGPPLRSSPAPHCSRNLPKARGRRSGRCWTATCIPATLALRLSAWTRPPPPDRWATPPRISPWLRLAVFGLLGLFLFCALPSHHPAPGFLVYRPHLGDFPALVAGLEPAVAALSAAADPADLPRAPGGCCSAGCWCWSTCSNGPCCSRAACSRPCQSPSAARAAAAAPGLPLVAGYKAEINGRPYSRDEDHSQPGSPNLIIQTLDDAIPSNFHIHQQRIVYVRQITIQSTTSK